MSQLTSLGRMALLPLPQLDSEFNPTEAQGNENMVPVVKTPDVAFRQCHPPTSSVTKDVSAVP